MVDRPRLSGAELQHPQPSPEDVEGQHPVSRFAGPLHLLIDSTGIKVEGKGEWNAREHGGTKRLVWRKIHNGKPWKHDTPGAIARNEALRASRRFGRTIWRRW